VEEVRKTGFRNNAVSMQHRNLRDRIAAMEIYGGPNPKCACCNEAEWSLLTLDHIHGGGNAERKKFFNDRFQAGHHMYRELRLREFPPGYQVLCMNCNFGRGMNNGTCPHAEKPVGSRERLAAFEKLRADGGLNQNFGDGSKMSIKVRRKRRHKKVEAAINNT
jgi:hypothetical protein